MKLYEIINESNWCKDKNAILANGDLTFSSDPKAAKRCLLGWINYNYENPLPAINNVAKYIGVYYPHEVAYWNDEEQRTVEDIIKLCKDLNI